MKPGRLPITPPISIRYKASGLCLIFYFFYAETFAKRFNANLVLNLSRRP